MKRPILIATLGFIIVIIWGLYFNIVLFVLIVMILYILQLFTKNKAVRIIKIYINKSVIIFFCISFFVGNMYIRHVEKGYKTIYNSLEKVKAIGTVISEKEEKEYNNIYKIKVEQINGNKVSNKNFLLSIKKESNKKEIIKYGDKIYFEGEYVKPEEQRNYKGFDYSMYLKTMNIYGTLKVENKVEVIKANNLNFILLISNKFRNQIISNVDRIFPSETKGIFL